MFATLITVTLFALSATRSVLADFAVNSPTITQCKDTTFSWEAASEPYSLWVVNPDDPCDAVSDLGFHNGTTLTWKAALPAGMKIQISLEDQNGDEAWSDIITVGSSSDSSCVPANLLTAEKPAGSSTTLSGSGTVSLPPTNVPNDPISTPTTSVEPVGAANAGHNPLSPKSGGIATHKLNGPLVVVSAVFAIFALTL